MENKYLVLIIIAAIAILSIFSVFGFYFITSQISDTSMEIGSNYNDSNLKNVTFGEINVSVPADLTFKNTDTNNIYFGESFESDNNMIFIESYSRNSNGDNLEQLFSDGFKTSEFSETSLDGLPKNSKAYADTKYPEIIYIIVMNENKDQGIVLTVVGNEQLAIKMANSVVFPN